MARCRDIMKLEVLRGLEVVAGHDGLDKQINWAIQIPVGSIDEKIEGGELVIIPGAEYINEGQTLENVILDSIAAGISGIAFLKGSSIEKISDELIAIADKNEIPIFYFPEEAKLVEIVKAIGNLIIQSDMSEKRNERFLNKILFTENAGEEQILGWAEAFGVEIKTFYSLAIFHIEEKAGQKNLKATRFSADSMYSELQKNFSQQKIVEVSKISGNDISYFITADSQEILEKIMEDLEKLQANLEEAHKRYDFILSFGPVGTRISQIINCYNDAKKGIKLALTDRYEKKIIKPEDLGIYRLLFEIQDEEKIIKYRDEVLGPIVEYDKQNGGEMFKTLNIYLQHNGNMTKAAEQLIIHRNTLLYRIDKIRSLLQKNLDDVTIRLELMSAMMVEAIYPYY